jgi:hypothetical protein
MREEQRLNVHMQPEFLSDRLPVCSSGNEHKPVEKGHGNNRAHVELGMNIT